jgi:hypothetical protein
MAYPAKAGRKAARAVVLVAAVALGASLAAAEEETTVASLVEVVRTAIQHREADHKLAKKLHGMVLTERLEDRVIEELESEGAGPESVEELSDLREESANRPAPVVALPGITLPAPEDSELRRTLHETARNAMEYAQQLPDFICTQNVRRYERLPHADKWKHRDVLTVQLTYFGLEEKYKLVAIDGHATSRSYQSAGGSLSEGEFGSILREVFAAQTRTEFEWDHWTKLRGRTCMVFSYKIDGAHSHYDLRYFDGSSTFSTVPAARGFIYVDREGGELLRLIRVADIDPTFPVTSAKTYLDYDFAVIGGHRYLVPVHLELRMATALLNTRNDVVYQDYRKFSGDSKITFGPEADGKP